MPEHLRALLVILVLAAGVFLAAERFSCPTVFTTEDFRRRRNTWFAITLVAFLSHNFWVYAALSAVIVRQAAKHDANPFALYLLLLFALPMIGMDVPGFGIVNYVISLNHVRILNLVILLPLAVSIANTSKLAPLVTHRRCDWLVLSYLAYTLAVTAPVVPLTGLLRNVVGLGIDIWLPYFVASRCVTQPKQWREVIGAFVLAAAVMAPMAVFESLQGWLLYSGLGNSFGTPPPTMSTYLRRGEEGALRALVTANHSIVFGYVMMIALVLYLYVVQMFRRRSVQVLGFAVLAAGLVAGLSRGPWVGAAAGIILTAAIGRGAGKRLIWLAATCGATIAALLLLPQGQNIIDYLPFVGSVDAGNVTYRQQLVNVSLEVFWKNPVFGSLFYIYDPIMEQMRQGQGIIDMVNSYLAVALPYGIIGLVLFVAPFIYASAMCAIYLRSKENKTAENELLCRVLLGSLFSAMLTIATVSSIGLVPTIYWILAGLCIGFARYSYFEPKQNIFISDFYQSVNRGRRLF